MITQDSTLSGTATQPRSLESSKQQSFNPNQGYHGQGAALSRLRGAQIAYDGTKDLAIKRNGILSRYAGERTPAEWPSSEIRLPRRARYEGRGALLEGRTSASSASKAEYRAWSISPPIVCGKSKGLYKVQMALGGEIVGVGLSFRPSSHHFASQNGSRGLSHPNPVLAVMRH